jgi:hypothetical protein
VPFLGAAANFRSDEKGLPLGKDVAMGLVEELLRKDQLAAVRELTELTKMKAEALGSYADLAALGVHNLARVALHYRRENDAEAFLSVLRRILKEDKAEPSPLLSVLARLRRKNGSNGDLPLRLIVTTNYDGMMERALKSRQIAYEPVYQPITGFEGEVDLQVRLSDPTQLILYKIHGSFSEDGAADTARLIITEDDYIGFLTVATRKDDVVGVPTLIEAELIESTLLFLGYSLEDWDFRTIYKGLIERLEEDDRRTSFAIHLNPPGFWVDFWGKKGVTIVNMDVGEFATKLVEQCREHKREYGECVYDEREQVEDPLADVAPPDEQRERQQRGEHRERRERARRRRGARRKPLLLVPERQSHGVDGVAHVVLVVRCRMHQRGHRLRLDRARRIGAVDGVAGDPFGGVPEPDDDELHARPLEGTRHRAGIEWAALPVGQHNRDTLPDGVGEEPSRPDRGQRVEARGLASRLRRRRPVDAHRLTERGQVVVAIDRREDMREHAIRHRRETDRRPDEVVADAHSGCGRARVAGRVPCAHGRRRVDDDEDLPRPLARTAARRRDRRLRRGHRDEREGGGDRRRRPPRPAPARVQAKRLARAPHPALAEQPCRQWNERRDPDKRGRRREPDDLRAEHQ